MLFNIIPLQGKILTADAQELKKQFDKYCERLEHSTLIDMSEVTYISSYFIGVMMDIMKKHQQAGFELYFCGIDPQIYFVLKTAGLAEKLKIFDTKEEAMEKLKRA